MKANMLCACAMLLCFMSSLASGEIVSGGSIGDRAWASADSSTSLDYEYNAGSSYVYTTEAGEFLWEVEAFAEVECDMLLYSGQTCAVQGHARGTTDEGGKEAYVPYTEYGATGGFRWDADAGGPPAFYDYNTEHFDAMQGIDSDYVVFAMAYVPEGYNDFAWSYAQAYAIGHMEEAE